jgi:hypothetical protein
MNYRRKYKNDAVKDYGREPCSLDDLARFVVFTINKISPVVGFAWDIRQGNVSNTHDSPIDGVTNWTQRELYRDGTPKPTRYSGWSGRVWIRYADKTSVFGSDPFSRTLTHPGTGGGGGYNGPWEDLIARRYHYYRGNKQEPRYPEPMCYSWDYRFYDMDWPDLYKGHIFAMLSETNTKTHRFKFEDDEVAARDKQFLDMISLKTIETVSH